MDDVRAVMDAAGSERAVLFGVSEGAPLRASSPPPTRSGRPRWSSIAAYASEVRQPDYPWPPTAEESSSTLDDMAATIHETWGNVDWLADVAPSRRGRPRLPHLVQHLPAAGASPGAVVALERMDAAIDVRHVLPTIRVPTLVLHRLDTRSTTSSTAATSPRTSPGRGWSSCPASTTSCSSATWTPSSTRSRPSSPARGRPACPTTSWPPSW